MLLRKRVGSTFNPDSSVLVEAVLVRGHVTMRTSPTLQGIVAQVVHQTVACRGFEGTRSVPVR